MNNIIIVIFYSNKEDKHIFVGLVFKLKLKYIYINIQKNTRGYKNLHYV